MTVKTLLEERDLIAEKYSPGHPLIGVTQLISYINRAVHTKRLVNPAEWKDLERVIAIDAMISSSLAEVER